MLTNENKEKILHDSARECGLDSHIVTVDKQSELYTHAEQMMGKMSHPRNPHKNSYLFCDSVDACFYIDRETPCVTFTARWSIANKDLDIGRMEKAIIIINKMLMSMQEGIAELMK